MGIVEAIFWRSTCERCPDVAMLRSELTDVVDFETKLP